MFKVVNKIANGKSSKKLHDCADNRELANKVVNYFLSKIPNIRQTLENAPKDNISVSGPESCRTNFC